MKCKFNLLGLIALIAVTMFSMAACDLFSSSDDDPVIQTEVNLTVTNNTGYDALLLQVVLSSEDNWGGDKLDALEILNDGQSKTIKVEKGTYDIRITDNDPDVNDTYSRKNVVINSNTTITFTGADIDRADAYGTLKLEHNAGGSGIYRVDVLTEVGGESLIGLSWNVVTGFRNGQYYEFLKADNTPEYNFTYGTYGLQIMQYVDQDDVYITWEKKTPFTIIKNKQTVVTFDKGSDWINKTAANDSDWPSNDVWTSYGLHGFQKPAGASVINIGSDIDWYHGYDEYLYVTLDGDYNAFMNLKNQIDALGYENDLDQEGQDYILQVWTSNYNNFLNIYYNDTINIQVSKRASFYGNWGKGSYGIAFDWGSDSIYFYGMGIPEPFDGFYFYKDGLIGINSYEGTIEVGYWDDDFNYNYLFEFNISMEGDTLTVSGMPDEGEYVLTALNGVYERLEL